MSKYTIYVVLYNYKSSSLVDAVRSVYENASESAEIYMYVYDQHPLNRKDKLAEFSDLKYEHVFWDHQYTPINYKKKEVVRNGRQYIMLMSADVSFNRDWDVDLVKQMSLHPNSIVSGLGKANLQICEKYFIKNKYPQFSEDFLKSNYLDRNMIFSTRETLSKVEFPIEFKYWGEEEMMSIDAFRKNLTIYSCPSGYYNDNGDRNLENLYSPFSIEHNYNSFLDYINNASGDELDAINRFFEYHKIDYSLIKRIPYQVDDVLYDPNTLQMIDIGGERFIDGVNSIA